MRESGKPGNAAPLGTINIRNFGPIEKGRLEIMPLTVLTGPNNSGKSYAASLIRSAFAAVPTQPSGVFAPDILRIVDESVSKLSTRQKDHVFINASATSRIIRSAVSGYEKAVTGNIQGSFAAGLGDLLAMGAKSGTVRIDTNCIRTRIRLTGNRSARDSAPSKHIQRIKLARDPDGTRAACSVTGSVLRVGLPPAAAGRYAAPMIVESIARFMVGRRAFHLPATRSGILQERRAISASMIRHAPHTGPGGVEIPKPPGTVSDLVGDMMDIPPARGPFYRIALELESEMLQGRIRAEHKKFGIPEIKYRRGRHDMPVHLSSSAVSEMAPFILYLKHIVDRDSILIMEEPESHLDPGNQSVLARFLARLIRDGLAVVITTHSPFLLEQLNNLIRAGDMPPSRRKGIRGLRDGCFVTRDELAAYLFEPSRPPAGHTIRRMRISDEEGISTEEFVRASEALYNESLNIRDLAGED